MPKSAAIVGHDHSDNVIETFNVVGEVKRVRLVLSHHDARKENALILFQYGDVAGPDALPDVINMVSIRIPNLRDCAERALVVGSRLRILGHLATVPCAGDPTMKYIELHADKIEFLPALEKPAPPKLLPQPLTLKASQGDDLAHTLRCVAQTVSMIASTQSAAERFKSLDALASVCVFGKGHLFSDAQQTVYLQILELMRHDGREDGFPRTMTEPEQGRCARLWIELLSMAAARVGATSAS